MGIVSDYATASEWIKAATLPNLPPMLTIIAVSEQQWEDGRKQGVLHFEETDLKLGLNVTNSKKLAELFGHELPSGELDADPDELIGQKISLFRDTTKNKEGQDVPCVRIRMPRPAKAVAAAPKQPADVRGNAASETAGQAKAAAARLAKEVPVEDDGDPFADE